MKYITTPIYYVNDVPHLGHAYTTIIADTLARFYRLQGEATLLLTGTDEHGQKIEQAAKSRKSSPKEYADKISAEFKNLWDSFEINYDIYARTTDERHIKCVQDIFLKMFEKGDIYKGTYEGHYCISCESFFTQSQLKANESCPDCGKPTSLLKEESYFFKLSKYEKQILKWYEEQNPILPQNKTNELINFVSGGLKDLSITRTGFDWGIKLPKQIQDEKHIIYVWLDALFIYLSSLDYPKGANSEFFPAHIHLVGKDILKFHAIYWIAFLMSADLPLPRYIAAHGWWTRDGVKMSKSLGNVIKPKEVAHAYGLEAFRYFLLREVPFGNDGDFNEQALINRINAELNNELGNLLNRIIGMSSKYSNYKISCDNLTRYFKSELEEASKHMQNALTFLESVQTSRYLEELFKALALANLSISKYEPWKLIKNGDTIKANALVALCASILAKSAILLSPALPQTCNKIAIALGFKIDTQTYKNLILEQKLQDFTAQMSQPLFSKIEKALLEPAPKENIQEKNQSPKIKIDDFAKIELKVALVKDCQNIEGSEKLLKFVLELENGEQRQVLSGIAKYYEPQSLIGKQVCMISNLKKAKIFGYESDGMILSAKSGDKLVLISPQSLVENGALIG